MRLQILAKMTILASLSTLASCSTEMSDSTLKDDRIAPTPAGLSLAKELKIPSYSETTIKSPQLMVIRAIWENQSKSNTPFTMKDAYKDIYYSFLVGIASGERERYWDLFFELSPVDRSSDSDEIRAQISLYKKSAKPWVSLNSEIKKFEAVSGRLKSYENFTVTQHLWSRFSGIQLNSNYQGDERDLVVGKLKRIKSQLSFKMDYEKAKSLHMAAHPTDEFYVPYFTDVEAVLGFWGF